MSSSVDKALKVLLELGDPAERRTRAKLVQCALHAGATLMNADAVTIVTPWSRRGERLVLHAGSATPATLPPPESGSAVLLAMSEACDPVAVGDLSEDARFAAGDSCPGVEAGPALFIPLRQRNQAPAYVAVYRKRGRARFTMNDTRVMVLLGIWLGTALDHLRLSTGSQKLTVTDEATGVYNQRFLKAAVEREVRRARRFRQELSLMAIGVDRTGGSETPSRGTRKNAVLVEFGLALARQVRSFDIMGRYGEDGFMMVLPQTGHDGAVEVGNRMREGIRAAFPPESGVTVSLGIAVYPHDGLEPPELMDAAERALEEARARGGNCVATHRKAA